MLVIAYDEITFRTRSERSWKSIGSFVFEFWIIFFNVYKSVGRLILSNLDKSKVETLVITKKVHLRVSNELLNL